MSEAAMVKKGIVGLSLIFRSRCQTRRAGLYYAIDYSRTDQN